MIPAPPDVSAPAADAIRTPSGLSYKILAGERGGVKPGPTDKVTVHYTGWTTDGQMFDSSRQRGVPATFPLSGVIAGWTEGLQLVGEGQTARFWIPMNLAYHGRPGRPHGMLVFDVELLKVVVPAAPPQVPADVARPPDDATRTRSGLSYKELIKGRGGRKPTARSVVTVHYTGWTTNGEMFDSSVARGEPASFPLSRVIAGWTEGLQLMTPGATFRFWIPMNLAYQGRAGAPYGMLVFDVELLSMRG